VTRVVPMLLALLATSPALAQWDVAPTAEPNRVSAAALSDELGYLRLPRLTLGGGGTLVPGDENTKLEGMMLAQVGLAIPVGRVLELTAAYAFTYDVGPPADDEWQVTLEEGHLVGGAANVRLSFRSRFVLYAGAGGGLSISRFGVDPFAEAHVGLRSGSRVQFGFEMHARHRVSAATGNQRPGFGADLSLRVPLTRTR